MHLAIHRETRGMPGYVLTIAKGGAKLKAATQNAEPRQAGVTAPFPAGTYNSPSVSTKGLANYLSTRLRVPIQDKTGLDGRYEIHLQWAPNDSEFTGAFHDGLPVPARVSANPSSGSLFTALQEQLGL